MKHKRITKIMLVGILMATVAVSGCSANRVSLTDVSVEKHDSSKVKILWAEVYQQNGQTWAYGILKQPGLSPCDVKTHVDIDVLNSDGSIQHETMTKSLIVPRYRCGRGLDWKRFRVQLPELPEDSRINMTVHHDSRCDNNSEI